jgi:hypothetical protein
MQNASKKNWGVSNVGKILSLLLKIKFISVATKLKWPKQRFDHKSVDVDLSFLIFIYKGGRGFTFSKLIFSKIEINKQVSLPQMLFLSKKFKTRYYSVGNEPLRSKKFFKIRFIKNERNFFNEKEPR